MGRATESGGYRWRLIWSDVTRRGYGPGKGEVMEEWWVEMERRQAQPERAGSRHGRGGRGGAYMSRRDMTKS